MNLVPVVSDRPFVRRTAEPSFEYVGPRTLEEMQASYKEVRRRIDAPGLRRLSLKRAQEKQKELCRKQEEERQDRKSAAREIIARWALDVICVPSPLMRAIILVVGTHFDVAPLDIISQRRFSNVAFARHVVMYLARHVTPFAMPEIAKNLGGLDHSTVSHGIKKIERMVAADPVIAAMIQMLREDLSASR